MHVPDLNLWKWNKSSDEVKDSDLDDCRALDPRKTISDVFNGDILVQGRTHIIIKTPEPATGAVTTRKRSAPVQSSEVTDHVPKSPRLSQETG
ncbi:hypothetical protein L211DRAFT_336673 [Terfezia boudieri ATCC MYA-4762]|uniref:Uncharacterized protein n=1 Tax=Terfezia boudieri ATCC MYA-4762 TaxID=1051890 RepID=A0A3N4LHL0_9PEZI|nr:hypothetical protein L211DRAFT_336673 [Terfezia boudieri ATCC MYA-4762]